MKQNSNEKNEQIIEEENKRKKSTKSGSRKRANTTKKQIDSKNYKKNHNKYTRENKIYLSNNIKFNYQHLP